MSKQPRYRVSVESEHELKQAAMYLGLHNVRVWQTAPWSGEWRLSGTDNTGERVMLGAKSKRALHGFINRLSRVPR